MSILLGSSFVIVAVFFFALNLFGFTQSIRPQSIAKEDMRFTQNFKFTYYEAMQNIERLHLETDAKYVVRQTMGISKSFAHIKWNEEQDVNKYHQLIPLWENWILNLMGRLSGIEEFRKYHFTDYKRSLKRGIGICGDASMIMSQILHNQKISNTIVAFPHHVAIQVKLGRDCEMLLDPDFGVVVPLSISSINEQPQSVAEYYLRAGYPESEVADLVKFYGEEYTVWSDVKHFIRKKYYFEKCSYSMIWVVPILSAYIGFILLFA